MARLMLSAGMFSALAAATAVRSRGFFSGSPPPFAAMVISLIRRVKIFPRLASSAPFLCLMVAHFEWPDMNNLSSHKDFRRQRHQGRNREERLKIIADEVGLPRVQSPPADLPSVPPQAASWRG